MRSRARRKRKIDRGKRRRRALEVALDERITDEEKFIGRLKENAIK
jgi:hypothetical protein